MQRDIFSLGGWLCYPAHPDHRLVFCAAFLVGSALDTADSKSPLSPSLAWPGSARFGPARLGLAPLGPRLLGLAIGRLGWAWLGSGRLGLSRLRTSWPMPGSANDSVGSELGLDISKGKEIYQRCESWLSESHVFNLEQHAARKIDCNSKS